MVEFDANRLRAICEGRQVFTPLRTHTLDPRTEAINSRRGLGRVEINRQCDQNARAIPARPKVSVA